MNWLKPDFFLKNKLPKTALILAGGFGTRLRTVINDVPKPMAPINDKPFLLYQVNYLQQAGIKKIVFSTGYLSEVIETYFRQLDSPLRFTFSHEASPLGTGGGIRQALTSIEDSAVLVLNGDSFFELPLHDFFQFHHLHADMHTIALRSVADCSRYGSVKLNSEAEVISFGEKVQTAGEGLINAGVYVLNTERYLRETPADKPFSIEQDYFQKIAGQGHLFGKAFSSYFIDIGLPEDYTKAQHDFKRFAY